MPIENLRGWKSRGGEQLLGGWSDIACNTRSGANNRAMGRKRERAFPNGITERCHYRRDARTNLLTLADIPNPAMQVFEVGHYDGRVVLLRMYGGMGRCTSDG